MADIAAKTAQEQTNKMWNIFTCSMNRVTVDDSDEESEESSSDDEDVGLTNDQFKKKMDLMERNQSITSEQRVLREEKFFLSYAENVRRKTIRKEYQRKLDKEAEDQETQKDADLQKRIKYNIAILIEISMKVLGLNTEEDSIQKFEEKIKNAKAKIVKRKWNHKEERIRTFGGMTGSDSYRQLQNGAIFVVFIVSYLEMLYN